MRSDQNDLEVTFIQRYDQIRMRRGLKTFGNRSVRRAKWIQDSFLGTEREFMAFLGEVVQICSSGPQEGQLRVSAVQAGGLETCEGGSGGGENTLCYILMYELCYIHLISLIGLHLDDGEKLLTCSANWENIISRREVDSSKDKFKNS